MKRIVLITLALLIALSLTTAAQQPQPQPSKQSAQQPKNSEAQPQQKKPERPVIDRRKLPLADRPNLSLADVNTDIGVDRRVIVTMAALNIAGYDYESGNRQLSALRWQIREDLKGADPGLVQRLRNYFQKHRKGANDAAAVAPYLSLALSMTEPPAFTIDAPAERLPDDVREITEFALLLEEFYRTTGFSKLMPKYLAAYMNVAQNYGVPAGLALGTALTYLHTDPVLELPPLYIPRRTSGPATKTDDKKSDKKDNDKKKAGGPALDVPNRVRQFVIIPDLLNATGAANLRVVGDVYYLLLGPTTEPNVEAMRRAFLTFVIDPLTEHQIKEVAAIRDQLKSLMESRGDRLDKEYAKRNAYFLITDSLVRAIDARMDALGLAARRKSSEDEALYDLSLGYDRGAVLVYNFYDQMKAYEAVGVDIRDYLAAMLGNIDFKRESKRLDEYAQRLAHGKQMREEAALASAIASAPPPTISNADEKLLARIVEADQMIKARKYDEAKTTLESALKDQPNNARALYGMADVTSKKATTLEDADRVEEALFAAVEYYRLAAKNASPETEKWLMQRSYVAAAKILDFIAESNPSLAEKLSTDAAAAYRLAIELGKVEGGAYEEAEQALKVREQKQKP